MEQKNSVLWQKTLEKIDASGFFENDAMTWLENTTLFKIENGQAYVSYRSVIACNLLKKNLELFEDTLSEVWGAALKIQCISQKEMEEMMPTEALMQKTSTLVSHGFDPAYTFDSFVQGPSNQEALAACRAVCRNGTGLRLNPLLIYGNSGLGKTHLLNAVGNELKRTNPSAKVTYMYSGDLVSLLLESMRQKNAAENSVDKVKEQLLDCDYFLVDDIQNLRSPGCQEVFFTIYNELIARKKQIILTSDTHPSQLNSLAKRLISRFQSGLTVNISRPGAETAKAILKKKIAGHEDIFPIDNEVLDFLSVSFADDVRSLEGTLNRLIFNATLFNPPAITIEFAMGVLKDDPSISSQPSGDELDGKAIKKAVIRFYGLSYKDLEGKSRQKKIATARQICIYLMREMLSLPYSAIGAELGGRDHTTISSAYNKAKQTAAKNPEYQEAIDAIKKKLA